MGEQILAVPASCLGGCLGSSISRWLERLERVVYDSI